MKISLAYLPREETDAAAILTDIQRKHPGARVHKSERHPPFKHIYLTTIKPGKPCDVKENTCTTRQEVV